MDSNFSSQPNKQESGETKSRPGNVLVLHNDNVNTFKYVMETLVDVCNHSITQAEQCAIIAHYKGKCEVMSGDKEDLKKVRYELISRGLKTTIE
jgi:ATP-dependent Clp protease adaptor protein ClpS